MNFEKQLGVALHIQMNNGWDQKTYHLSPIHHSRGSSSKRENFHNIWRRGNGPYSRITVILGLIWEYEIPATIDLAGIIVLQVRGLQTVMQQWVLQWPRFCRANHPLCCCWQGMQPIYYFHQIQTITKHSLLTNISQRCILIESRRTLEKEEEIFRGK